MKQGFYVVISLLGLYMFSTATSYAVFSYVINPSAAKLSFQAQKGPTTTGAPQVVDNAKESKDSKLKKLLDNSGPKTEVCPLNGALYSAEEKKAWSKRRPLLVMIENHEDSRPQSGLSSTDVVYEAVAEGGITRFMGVFYCDAQQRESIVGPVRSARTFFMDWASEYSTNPLYAHVGGANCDRPTGSGCANGAKADALGQIERYGWGGSTGNDMNQFAIGYPTFWRDYERLGHTVATEHTMYSTTERLWAVAKERGWNDVDTEGEAWDAGFVPWKIYKTDEEPSMGTVTALDYNFWGNSPAGDYSAQWKFDGAKKVYLRDTAKVPHKDLNSDQQLSTQNLIVMFAEESLADDDYPGNVHLLYKTIGKGKGVLFQNGNATKITWEKKNRMGRTIFSDDKGKEVKFIAGRIWISTVPTRSEKLLEY